MGTAVVCAVPCGNTLGEGPVWDPSEGALYWVDIQEGLLHRWGPGTDTVERWTMPERVGALALRADRGLVLALASGFALFDPATDSKLERRAAPEAHLPGNRFNDGKCDARGRFWAGTMDDAALHLTGSLYRLDPDGSCSAMATGIGITNSLAWSPDNATFYLADTLRDTIFACDFDLESGTLANRHVFATDGRPARFARRLDGRRGGLPLERAIGRLAPRPLCARWPDRPGRRPARLSAHELHVRRPGPADTLRDVGAHRDPAGGAGAAALGGSRPGARRRRAGAARCPLRRVRGALVDRGYGIAARVFGGWAGAFLTGMVRPRSRFAPQHSPVPTFGPEAPRTSGPWAVPETG